MMNRLKELEDENRRVKKMYAEERIKADIGWDALQKKVVKPSRRKEVAQQAVAERGVSVRQACHSVGISETCYRYQPILASENQEIAAWLIKLTDQESDWGFGLCFN